jgi:hypothetical protein
MIKIDGILRYVLYCLLYLIFSIILSLLVVTILFFIFRTSNQHCRECGFFAILPAFFTNILSIIPLAIQYWKLYIDGYGDNRKLHFITPIVTGIITLIITIFGLISGSIGSFSYIIPSLCQILISYVFADYFDKIFLNET